MSDTFQLPDLDYDYDALEPFIDAQTMELHHSKHHAGYTAKLNAAIDGVDEAAGKTIEELLSDIGALPRDIRQAVANNGGGYYNHMLFWKMMTPGGSALTDDVLTSAIEETFGGMDGLKEQFTDKASTVFGSGWAWLCKNSEGKLELKRSSFQNNPIMKDEGYKVVLGLDVWEHAYYLKYQNRRPEYIENWWNVVNWQEVARLFNE
ncbi:superoxide dismutase [Candidatus Dojkabacteria bacterium]|uniref:Superoxide dismutase n=1 Tax=Candidatus Dojkabacteria bacterium TaxID=2099670 RepID=A0A955L6W0_9BACT|nr:superoxide dismutase [Candidatus Dojkabacteria bacterium]